MLEAGHPRSMTISYSSRDVSLVTFVTIRCSHNMLRASNVRLIDAEHNSRTQDMKTPSDLALAKPAEVSKSAAIRIPPIQRSLASAVLRLAGIV